jgi:hypothetical protein
MLPGAIFLYSGGSPGASSQTAIGRRATGGRPSRNRRTAPSEFLLDLNFIANINHYTLRLRFEGDPLAMAAGEASGLIRDGRIIGTCRPPLHADR